MQQLVPSPEACRAAAQLGRTVNGALDDSPLTPAAYRLLSYLSTSRAAAAVLAEKLAVSRPTVTNTTDWLVARGYVTREPDPEDGRRVTIAITSDGTSALADADELVGLRLSDVLSALDGDTAKGIVDALEHLLSALNTYRSQRHRARQ